MPNDGAVEKVDFLDFSPLCSLVLYFVILCGSMNYFYHKGTQRFSPRFTKDFFNSPSFVSK